MNTVKHTPGPWEAWKDDEGAWGILKDHAFLTTAFDPDFGMVAGSSEANARLIAAAPDLLEALKDARYALYGNGAGNSKMDAAISKAEGLS